MPIAIPEELVQQFRTVALERLDRVESSWASVLQSLDESAAVLLHRELHTLKGESKMLGFSDVNLVCHKLEDMLEVARGRGYAVDEDFDLAVNMAIRFMGMLVRKKVGAHLSGIDLPGFIRQIDAILAELKPDVKASRTTTGSMQPIKIAQSATKVSPAVRAKLAPIAVDAFVEYAAARGLRRDRLRVSWHGLRDLVGIHRAVVGPGQLAKHKGGAEALAREMSKKVEVVFDVGTAEATAEILGAIDTAVLHLVRNAIDHGIETTEQRVAAGKPASGMIRVHCGAIGEELVATITDDGRGVSFDEVHARAIDLGLVAPNEQVDMNARWFEILCQPGFTTRTKVSEVSGRGVGLDAVRVGILEVGGLLTATTVPGKGTTWRITIPVPKMTFEAHVLRAPGTSFPVVIDASWKQVDPVEDAPVIDLAHRLGLSEDRTKEPARYFARDGKTIGVVTDRVPQTSTARRLLIAPAPAIGDVAILEAVEGLLLHLDRIS
jgi:two-component system chemotaxis sensor kinase CheA